MPRFPAEMGYAGLRMTADEYLALDATENRYELIHGVVCMSPPADPAHGDVIVEVCRQLANFGARVVTEIDLRLFDDTVYRPDACAYRAGRITGRIHRLPPSPDLIVEALSPGNKPLDLITKLADYDRAGVGEYWVVDPATLRVRRWVRQASGLVKADVPGDIIPCETIPGFQFDLRPLRTLLGEQPS